MAERLMKDSGIEWIGQIPSSWEMFRIKDVASDEYNSFIDGDWIESPYIVEEGIRYLTTGNIGDGKYKEQGDGYISEITFKALNCKYAYAGDLVFSRLNAPYGRSCILPSVKDKYVLAVDNVILRTKHDKRFICYVSQCDGYQHSVEDLSAGTTMKRISRTNLGKIKIPVPSITEQQKIADFLDSKCSEIDSLTKDIESQIETLEQYKKSVITEAVTKGLNPDVEMKDSEIEYVGKIPVNWDIHPVYYYFDERKNKNYALKEQNLLSLSYGKIIRKDINTNGGLLPASFNTYNIIEPNDIIIRPTDLQNDKRSLRTGLATERGIITSAYIDLAPIDTINSQYFHYLLHSFDVMKVFYNMGNGVRQGLNYAEFSKLMVFCPPKNEQDEIVEYLNTRCSEIDSIISDKKKQLETLAEYKKSLIYEYLTGKKEVA